MFPGFPAPANSMTQKQVRRTAALLARRLATVLVARVRLAHTLRICCSAWMQCAPHPLPYAQVLEYIEEAMPPETPLAFGLHPNAEIGFKLREAEAFCGALVGLQPSDGGGEGGLGPEEKAKMVLDDLAERLPENFDLESIRGRVDEFTPYVMVAIQVRHPRALQRALCGGAPRLHGQRHMPLSTVASCTEVWFGHHLNLASLFPCPCSGV